ncbi:MAG TPA: hypothetical protein VFD74_06620 [Thermoleophilia bacterium]|nr:hypothetical protein [Thermoleophilia bacterium]
MTQIRILGEILDILADLHIPHMVVGSFASGFHGEFRATQDADLVIDPTVEQLDALLELVSGDFYVSPEAAAEALSRRGQFNLVHFDSAWKIDLIIRKERPFSREEFARRQEGNLSGRQAPVNSPEDVILAKLEWAKNSGSTRQIEDAAGVIAAWGGALDWDYIDHWARVLSVEDLLAQVRSPISGNEG